MSTEPQIGRLVPLKQVVAYFSDETDRSEGDQDRFWILGLRALVELNYEISAQPQTFRLPVNGNKTVNFPVGCLTWSKIGLMDNNGAVSTLKINNGLTTWRDNNPNRLELLTPEISDSFFNTITNPIWFNYFNDGCYINFFGIGNGLIQYGECTVDETNQIVVLSPKFLYDTIMFEGIFAPQREEDYVVPLALQEAIIAFIKWKMKLDTAQNYYAEVTKARRRMPKKKVTLQVINQVVRESEGMKLRS